MGTAREKVRIAKALFDLPQTSAAFEKGDLSYSKARAMTRVANPSTEGRILDYALAATAQQVDNHCLQLRNVERDLSTADANRVQDQRYLTRTIHADGRMTISIELPRGEYEIKWDVPDNLIDEDNLDFDQRVLRPSLFRFDFSEFPESHTYVTFQYFSAN